MKNILLLIVCVLLTSLQLDAQEDIEFQYKNALKISPVQFGASAFQMTYERYFNDRKSSLLIMPMIILREGSVEKKKGLELMLQYRFFLTHLRKGRNKTIGMYNIGLFTGAYANGLIYEEERQETYHPDLDYISVTEMFKKEIQSVEGGVLIGFQMDITKRILLDFYVGGGMRFSESTDEFDSFRDYYIEKRVLDKDYTGVKPKIGFQLGFAF